MPTFNAVGSVVDALKTWPEPVSLPESLRGADPVKLAEARNRLQQISQCANELRKTVDMLLASHLDGGALRYGESIMRASLRGRPKIVDEVGWWEMIVEGLSNSESPEALLSALYPASAVRLTALGQLAETLDTFTQAIRNTFIEYEPPTAALDVVPLSKAPKWTQQLEEGTVGKP